MTAAVCDLQCPARELALARAAGDVLAARSRVSVDVPGADLAYTWRGPSTDPGGPGRAASARACCREGKVQPCRSSNQVTVRPPRRRPHRAASPATSPSPRPSSASPPQARSCGTPGPPRSVTSTRTTPPAARTVTVTVSPAAPEPLCRTLFPNSSLTSSAASSRHGCPGPGTPAVNARATRARSARPDAVTLSRTTALATSAPAFPGPPRGPGNHPGPQPGTRGCTPGSAARVKPGTRRRRGPSVAVRETADGAHRP